MLGQASTIRGFFLALCPLDEQEARHQRYCVGRDNIQGDKTLTPAQKKTALADLGPAPDTTELDKRRNAALRCLYTALGLVREGDPNSENPSERRRGRSFAKRFELVKKALEGKDVSVPALRLANKRGVSNTKLHLYSLRAAGAECAKPTASFCRTACEEIERTLSSRDKVRSGSYTEQVLGTIRGSLMVL